MLRAGISQSDRLKISCCRKSWKSEIMPYIIQKVFKRNSFHRYPYQSIVKRFAIFNIHLCAITNNIWKAYSGKNTMNSTQPQHSASYSRFWPHTVGRACIEENTNAMCVLAALLSNLQRYSSFLLIVTMLFAGNTKIYNSKFRNIP